MLKIGDCYKLIPDLYFDFHPNGSEVSIQYKTASALEKKIENPIFIVVDESQRINTFKEIEHKINILLEEELVWFHYSENSKLHKSMEEYILKVI